MLHTELLNDIANFKLVVNVWHKVGDNPFYASDFDFNGGQMRALSARGLVKSTGNTKESFILIDEWHEYYKKVSVKEWQVDTKNMYKFVNDIERICEELKSLIQL